MNEQTMDQSLNIGSEIRLSEGCIKHVKIGSVKLIRQVRQLMKDVKYKFSHCIGRELTVVGPDEIDFPAMETTYKELFTLLLVDGLTDEEYDEIDEFGIEELDKVLERFL
ncbi:hypothetical protein [Paenibacillus sp. UMB4589-SE434]|uniref:hypothetical protein n=1 Tax=Paenibacillus sp. UMB4589-SE434 TaxID=3046314 RepID=UPI00254A01EB|nr:hypothetical protein [Paenibacillus sp. UMB4589-SE434]MDK8182115.1 hypothetical protein [Paenibacillus sp. UMB4589-SE434]